MKKLFALVLSLALVVAFAVPAMATGWASLDPAPVYKDITISVTGLETEPNTVGVGKLYEPLSANANYPVVKGTKLHFLVELTVPYGSLSSATTNLIKNVGLKLAIETTNMEITSCKTNSESVDTSSTEKVTDLFESADAAEETVVYSYEVWAKALSDDEAKVVATAGFYNKWDEGTGTMKIYNAKGNLAYTVTDNGESFLVENSDEDTILFPVKSTGKIDTKGILVNEEWLITFGSQNGTIDFYSKINDTWASGTSSDFAAVNAVYEDIFGFLGFKFAECDYMTAGHFKLYFGTIGEISASYSWNAGKVVVNPVTPDLPQTGDNASIVGFAMIVVAMVAAAVVTVKKVRA
jgi:LPXTG-motif cell wall-anchored protein